MHILHQFIIYFDTYSVCIFHACILSGLELKGNVVIIDEAHNLIEAINNVNSCCVTLNHIQTSNRQLQRYYDRYKDRLLGKNVMYIKQILTLLASLSKYLLHCTSSVKEPTADVASEVMSINDFLCAGKI